MDRDPKIVIIKNMDIEEREIVEMLKKNDSVLIPQQSKLDPIISKITFPILKREVFASYTIEEKYENPLAFKKPNFVKRLTKEQKVKSEEMLAGHKLKHEEIIPMLEGVNENVYLDIEKIVKKMDKNEAIKLYRNIYNSHDGRVTIASKTMISLKKESDEKDKNEVPF